MPEILIVPLVLATLFTTGGMLIQRLERHAERITGVLGVVLLFFSFLDILAVFSRFAEAEQHAASRIETHQIMDKPPPKTSSSVNLARLN